ncbi:titin-like isoform X2 [Girardinichthys multiradiatus]|uniref:titin-like isoform X2 n=1 Tax=Girardinichthys multiradiatus TaxID=208333 RepID=UPI001FAD93DB|nr:titin-like isoform X2 [Girardinichthys multiradiatus]
MKKDDQSLMAALSENVLTVNMLLIVFFLPGVLADCGDRKPTLFITTPKKIEALNGSCLHITCSFNTKETTFNSSRTIYGIWMKQNLNFNHNPSLVIFNSSGSVNTYSLNIAGHLREGNCTTLFPDLKTSYTDKYFFRVENGPFRATACADPLQITVKDSPWSPSINISGGDLKEHQSVTITCSALTPCPHSPPELTWNLQQDSHRQTEKNTDGTFTTKIQENITLSDTHDGYIRCSARYPVNGGNKTAETAVTLSVSYAPRNTSASIRPSGLVSAGSWVELNCSSRAKPPASFTWFRNSKHGAINVSVGQVYSFSVTEGGEFYCVATNDLGNETSSRIFVGVKDSPWSPSINISGVDLKEHQSVTITCSALTPCPHSPPELTWNLQQDSHRQTEKNTDGTFTTKIQENITLSDTHDGYIRCSARYPVNGGNKTAETAVTLSVSYAPRNTSASIRPSGLVSPGSWVELNCSSRAKPPASFTWFRNSKHGAINVSVGQIYSFNVTEGGEFYCVATNDLGNETSSRIFVGVKGVFADCGDRTPTLFITTPKEIEALNGSCLHIPCSFNTKETTFNSSRTIYGIWMKHKARFGNPASSIFNSSGSVNTYSLNITGNLREGNCTTLFPDLKTSYTDKYFFRVENGPFRATACADPLQITVKDSPWSPSINISGGDLKEHQSVTITCSALTPCPHSPPELTWNLQQDSHRQTEKNTDGTFTTKIQENITLSDTHDGYIRCSARYPVNGGNKTAETAVTLSVSYAPRNTSASISPSGLVSAGSWVELNCSSRAKPPASFTWFRNSKHGAINVSVGQVYSFSVTEGGEFYCVATNDLGNETSSRIFVGVKGVFADCGDKKPALFITTPKEIEALNGSCLHIPCSFNTKETTFNNSRTIYGMWMKHKAWFGNPAFSIFNSSGSVNTYSLNITGNLREGNCTTLFPDLKTSYTDKYFFRVENGPFRATACADPLQITVKDSPWSPSIKISGVDLKEHQSVTITCSALTPCPHSPPELTWNLQQDSHRQTEKNTDGTFTTKIQENIILSDTHDGYIRCSARYPVNGGNKTAETAVALSVSYAPKDTSASIRPSGLVSAGSWVELNCSSRAKPPASFTWFRNSKHGAINVSVGQIYSFSVTEGGEFYCVATNDLGNETSSRICVGVKDSPWSPSINISGGDLKEHQSVTITCSALTSCPHSPPELTWNLQQDSHRQTEKNTDGTFTTKIQENITLSDTHDGYIRCSARYPVNGGNKTAETAVTLSVSYAPRNTSASISPSGLVSAGSWVELNCSSRAKPPASFTWFRNSKHGDINVSVGQVYSFSVTEGGEFYCVATNDLGNETSSRIFVGVKGVFADCGDKKPALFITTPKEIEALNGSCLHIPCSFNTKETTFNSSRTIYGMWMKHKAWFGNPASSIFNSSGSVNTYSLNITGNLREGNCTTLFPDLKTSYTDKYFFRVENGPFRATACADPLQITVKDSPWSPSINISGGDLKEHQSVTITCSALTPCPHSPPELTWNLQQDSHRQSEKNTDGTFTTKIQENITLSDTHDGYIRCSARYPVNGGNKTAETAVTLSVSYAPRNTSASISPSGLVSAGSWVELNCSSRAKPPASFTWFRNSKHGAINVSLGQVYSFSVSEGGEFYCVATNDLGNETSSRICVGVKGVLADCGDKKPALFITTPKEIEALNGSCLHIPCSFNTKEKSFNSRRTIYGIWMKHKAWFGNPASSIFNSSGSVNTYSLNITGNLREGNCTTLFPDLKTSYTDKYFFRVENGPFRATACADPLQITVKDSPWSPSINISGGDLKEHQSVTITCSALTPCPHSPPELTWNLQQDSHRQTEKNTDGTFTTKIQENITLTDTHDGYIRCSARYPVNGGNKTAETAVTLSVSYAPRNTSASIRPSGLVSAGSWVELNCYSRAKPPASFTWFRNSKHGAINVSVGQVYRFSVTEGGEFYCVATNDLGNETSSRIFVGVKGVSADCGYKKPALFITTPKEIEALNGSCLHIPCSFNTKEKSFNSRRTIYGIWMKHKAWFGNPASSIFNSSGSVNTYSLNITGNLREGNCTTLFPDLKTSYTDRYFFRVENGPFRATACADPLQITVKDSPWSPSINISGGDLKEHQSVTITCSALTPCPHSPPELTWNLQQDSHRQTEKNTDGTFTTKIQENITLSDTHDGYIRCSARYPVNGGNKTAETAVTLSVSYAPRNTSASIRPSGLVSPGSWVELSCSSRAKPPASFTWFRNSKHGAINVSVGQVYSFSVTEGGEFYCVATNDLGNETSSRIFVGVKGVLADCGDKKPALFITTPKEIEALNGSCLHIPCSFNTKEKSFNSRTIYGIWMKHKAWFGNPASSIFNSSGSVNTYSLNITGNLREGNCTTLFPDLKTSYTDRYFFRVENGPFRATACADPLQITVKDSPWSPSISISGGDLKEHQSVTITCSALTPCPHSPPELTWNLQQDSHRQTEKNTDGTFTTKIQENITLSDTHDGYNIRCSARYPVNGGNKTAETAVTLSVSYAPRNTSASISPSGLVSAGSWVELNCSSRAKPPASFTWFRNSKHGAINVSVGQVYSFSVTEGGEFYCVATNDLGHQTSSRICVGVKDSPWSPSINISGGDLKEHQSVTITCSALTPCPHSPPELTWNLQQDSHRQTEKNTDGTFTTKIQENITLLDTHDGYNIRCSARYPVNGGNKTAETAVTLSVSYAPRKTSASIRPSGLVSAGSWVKLSCSSRAKPPASFTWFRKSKHGAINVSVGRVYRFSVTEGGEFYCVATNDLGHQTSSRIFVRVKGVLADCGYRKPALSITTPKEIEALNGSCLHIPCSFNTKKSTFNRRRTIYGIWMKHKASFGRPASSIFNSSGSVNTYSLNITGNLREGNCTTLFPDLKTSYTDKYFFRVENGPFRATACADPLQITVKDSPWSPSINISGGDLKEHQSVTITCSALTPCPHSPPELTWNLQQDSHRQTEKNTDGTFTTKIQENITLSDTHDGYIRCSARYPVNGGNKTAETAVALSVSYAPRNTSASISPSGLVSAGSWVELNCSSRAKPHASFTWFRNSKHGDINVSVGQIYSFSVTEGGEFYCVATNDLGNETSSRICVGVKDSPWSPSINISGGDLKEHQSVTITCSALTPCPHSPPELTWNLQQDSHRQTEKNTDGTFTTKIQENITLSDTHDGYNIRCSARYSLNGGNKTAETAVTLSVSYAPKDTSASISPSGLVSAGSWEELNCSSRAKPPASFTWLRNSKHGGINISVGQVYSFNVTEGGEFYCVATNDLGNQTSSVIFVGVKDSPSSPSIKISGGDLKEHQSVTITCSALTLCPHSPPELTWNLQQDSHRQTEKNTDGTFTTKIQENITLSDTHDGYNIRCSALYPVNGGNKTAETAVTLSVSYAPRNTSASISPSGLVSAGSWVELNCSSRAKPPANFTWFRNSKHGAINVSVGQIYSFSVTEGGEFYCVATNDLGNQTSSVILLNTQGFPAFVAIVVGVILFTFLILFCFVSIIIYLKQ